MRQRPAAPPSSKSTGDGDHESPGSEGASSPPPTPADNPDGVEVKPEELQSDNEGSEVSKAKVEDESDDVSKEDNFKQEEDVAGASELVVPRRELARERDLSIYPHRLAKQHPRSVGAFEFRRELDDDVPSKAREEKPIAAKKRSRIQQPLLHQAPGYSNSSQFMPAPLRRAQIPPSPAGFPAFQSQDKHSKLFSRTLSPVKMSLTSPAASKSAAADNTSTQTRAEAMGDSEGDALYPVRHGIINGVMSIFIDWMDSRLGVRVRTGPSHQPQAQGDRRPRKSKRLGAASFGSPVKRRRSNSDAEDVNDDGSKPPRNKLTKLAGHDQDKLKLACPFFKHNPRKYKNQRPCCGPGWDHVHRIKEHIYRKHSLPKFTCHRCCEPFEVEEQLQAHARAATPCGVREPQPSDGITQDQEKKLRSRKKNGVKELAEPEKWKQMFQVLFPDTRENEIPSPYYLDDSDKTNLSGYEDYLRRELPPLVRRRLEEEVERELHFVEDGLKGRVIEIARNLQLTLFRSYQQTELEEEATPGLTHSSGSEPTTISPQTLESSSTPEFPDPLHLLDDPSFALPSGDDFDFSFLSHSYDLPSLQLSAELDLATEQSDSRYNSIILGNDRSLQDNTKVGSGFQ